MLMEGLAGPVSDEQADMLKKVLTSSQHLLDVVNSVLEIARLKSGKIELNSRFCDPRLTVEKCVSSVLPQAQRKGLELRGHADSVGCPGLYDEGKTADNSNEPAHKRGQVHGSRSGRCYGQMLRGMR